MNTIETEIVQGIDVQHLTDDFDRVAIKMSPSGELSAVPGRDDELPFESYKFVADEVALSEYDRVCEHVTEQLRYNRPVSFGEQSRSTPTTGFEKVSRE